MADLVTGEAVVVDLRLARLASRALALALDLVIELTVLFGGALLLLLALAQVDGALRGALLLAFVILVLVGYPVTLETTTRGRSVGKLALGLRVVREDGGPIRFRHALTRALAGFFVDFGVLGMFGAVALVCSLSSRRGARVGDLLAGTMVIQERVPAPHAVPLTMPPALAGWASALQLAAIPDDLALAARQYLNRARQLTPAASHAMATRLADEMSRQVGPPPPGTPPAVYLAAVLAERRDRELTRRATPPAGASWASGPSTGAQAGTPTAAAWAEPTRSPAPSRPAQEQRQPPPDDGDAFAPPS